MNPQSPQKIMVVMGTRPEVIKLAPIVIAAKKHPDNFQTVLVSTGQHREMLDQMLSTFMLTADYDLNIMEHDQTLATVTTAALKGLSPVIESEKPDVVIVQGDTTTTFAGALAAFYNQVDVAHIEAGLRTFDKYQPFPEEINRRLTTQLAEFHFAPTKLSRDNLLGEGIDAEKIWVTGNTCIDSLNWMLEQRPKKQKRDPNSKNILLTTHRRENHGKPMENICKAILLLVDEIENLTVTYPLHMSPRVRQTVTPILSKNSRIKLIEPASYRDFVVLMDDADLILTDSGGVQEEAPSLGKPVLVLRDKTERPEGIVAGTLKIVGTDTDEIVRESRKLLLNQKEYNRISKIQNPYGDGKAANRILNALNPEFERSLFAETT